MTLDLRFWFEVSVNIAGMKQAKLTDLILENLEAGADSFEHRLKLSNIQYRDNSH